MKQFEMIIKRWRNQPFKTKHTPSFKITKENGWGYEEKISGYPVREPKEIKTFDIKKFVDENKKEEDNPFASPFASPFVPPFAPRPASKTPSSDKGATNVDDLVKRIDEQIAKIEKEEKENKENSKTNDFETLVNKKYEEFKENKAEAKNEPKVEEPKKEELPLMGSEPSGPIDIDELLKRIDAKIAELEEEEKEEAEKNSNNISTIETENNEVQAKEETNIEETSVNSEPTEEKATVNVDADSIVMNEHITDDEFFDDFFGDDE